MDVSEHMLDKNKTPLTICTKEISVTKPNPNKSAVDWRKVLLVLFMIFELGPYLESLWNGLPSEPIRCGVNFFTLKNDFEVFGTKKEKSPYGASTLIW